MPRKSLPKDTATDTTASDISIEDRLDAILLHLSNLDRRDKLRTWGGFVRGILALIPLILLLWSAWYFVEHGQEFIENVTKEAVKQSAAYSQGSLMEQLEKLMGQ